MTIEESSGRKIAFNAILNTSSTVLSIIFPLITFPYISRVLGVECLGVYNFSASINSYFLLIAALGISTYGIREGTQYRNNKEEITRFVSEVFSINLISTLVAYGLLGVLIITVSFLHYYSLAIIILSIEIVVTTLGVAWVCNIYEDFLFMTIRTVIFQLLSLILIFTLVKTADDLYVYIAILVFASSGSNFLNFFYIRRKYCKFHFTFDLNIKRHLKPIMIIFSTTVAITIYVSADITMLGFMTSDYQVGLYGTAVKIYTILKNVLAAVLMVLIPQFALLFSKGRLDKLNALFTRVFEMLTVLMLPMSVGLFFISEDVVILISGRAFIGSAPSLRFLSIAIIFSLYSFLYIQCVLIPAKKENIVFKATLTSAVVNIILNFIMIPLWGIYAAAITTIVAEAITFAISYVGSRQLIHLTIVKNTYISTIIGCFAISLVCCVSMNIEDYFIRLSTSIILSVCIYALILWIMKNRAFMEIRQLIKKRNPKHEEQIIDGKDSSEYN